MQKNRRSECGLEFFGKEETDVTKMCDMSLELPMQNANRKISGKIKLH
jgi:hypothetical protein